MKIIKKKKKIDIYSSAHMTRFGITFTMYAQRQKIGKPTI